MFSFSWQISRTWHICTCTWWDFAKVSQFMLLFFFFFFTIFFLNMNVRRNISLKVAWKTHLDWASKYCPKAYNHKEKDMFCRWEECVQSQDNVQRVYSLLLLAVLCLSVEAAAFSDSRWGVCYAQECACFYFVPVLLYHPCSLSWYANVFKRPAIFCSLFSKTDFLWWPNPRLFSNRESISFSLSQTWYHGMPGAAPGSLRLAAFMAMIECDRLKSWHAKSAWDEMADCTVPLCLCPLSSSPSYCYTHSSISCLMLHFLSFSFVSFSPLLEYPCDTWYMWYHQLEFKGDAMNHIYTVKYSL